MRNILIFSLCLLFLSVSAYADWEWVKNIDASDVLGTGRLKNIEADANGSLYFTTNFGGDPRYIWKIANPITETTPNITQFTTDSYGSLNGGDISISSGGNVYMELDYGYDTSEIRKYKSNGALDTSSYGGDGIIGPPVGDNKSMRCICYVESENVLLAGTFEAYPVHLFSVNAITGATYENQINVYSCESEVGDVTAINSQAFGIDYDPVEKAIYYNAFGDLIKLTSSGTPDLTDLTTFDTYELIDDETRNASISIGLGMDLASRLVASTAYQGPGNAMQIIVYNMDTGEKEFVGPVSGEDGYINLGGACDVFTFSEETYLAAMSYYGNSINLFKYSPPLPTPTPLATSTPSSGMEDGAWEIYY